MTKLLGALVASLLLASCQTAPTVANDNPDRRIEAPGVSMMRPIEVTLETIVVDVRAAFDYSSAHIPRSINLNWADFTEPEPAQRGILQADQFAIARRLARLGIDPATHVVVVGNGKNGMGEEGRVAWMLSYLGVDNVQFAEINSLGARFSNALDTNQPKSAPMWKPEPLESLNVTKDEVLFAINQRAVEKPASYKGRAPKLYKILDVRDAKAYLGHTGLGSQKTVPNMDAVNVPWTEFFDEGFRPRMEIESKLKSVGITEDSRIIVLDENGVASAAVTMALRSFGFKEAGNYAGGLRDLLSR